MCRQLHYTTHAVARRGMPKRETKLATAGPRGERETLARRRRGDHERWDLGLPPRVDTWPKRSGELLKYQPGTAGGNNRGRGTWVQAWERAAKLGEQAEVMGTSRELGNVDENELGAEELGNVPGNELGAESKTGTAESQRGIFN